MARRLRRDEYTVGWVCALPDEFTAAQEMLDEEHQDLPPHSNDTNIYTLGSIGEHNVVLACLPAGQTGTNSAAAVAMQMKATFPTIRFGLMVGVGGGVPSEEVDIRLGDIVVSQPGKGHGGVVQYDFGKSTPTGFERTGFLNAPPAILLSAVSKLRSNLDRRRADLSPHLSKLSSNLPKFARDQAGNDVLFETEYTHEASCAAPEKKDRKKRKDTIPMVHYGAIASGNQVMRDGKTRKQVSSEFGGVLCFEMEAAGLMNSFPCLVVRGICDYADEHKDKKWQPYAAGAAAAYTKELLKVIPATQVGGTQTADEAMKEQGRSPNYYLPFQRNRQFVGRDTELHLLKQKLFVDKDCQKVALVGLGGIGKTQVALCLAHSVKQAYPEFSIYWVPAMSMEAFEQAYVEIARVLGIRSPGSDEDIRKLVRQRLSDSNAGKWLLIADNADDMDVLYGMQHTEGLLDFLPVSDDGLTVFTTRHAEVAQSVAGSDVVDVEKMGKDEAVGLLTGTLVRKDCLNKHASVESLLTELDYLPLAITQAAAYININRSSISEYLRLLKSTKQDAIAILSREFRDNTRYKKSANAVAKTWTITFNQIRGDDNTAAELLAFISCIEWRAIPYSILPPASSEALLADAIGTLCSYSFLEKRDDNTLDMHRLVHLAARVWVEQSDNEAETKMAALRHLSQVFPSSDWTNRQIWRGYLPHVARIHMTEQSRATEEKSELCLKVGKCLQVDGRIREAVQWLQESCEWRDTKLTQDHPDRLASQHELGCAYYANRQMKEAVKLLEQVVAIQAELADNHPDRLVSQHELARAYHTSGQVKKAVKLLEWVTAIKAKEGLSNNHPDQLASQFELGCAYHANGQIKEAIELLEPIVAIQAELADNHPNRLASQHELARVYHADGQVKEAVELLEQVTAIEAEELADNHPDRLASQYELACVYHADGEVRKTVELLKRIIAIEADEMADNHHLRLASQHLLASIYHADGQAKEAVELLEQVVAIEAEELANNHPDRLASQHELARVYYANGQVKEAIELQERVVAIQAELADNHPNRLVSEELLSSFYEDDLKSSELRRDCIEDVVAEDDNAQGFNESLEPPRTRSGNSSRSVATSNPLSKDEELKSSGRSKRRRLTRRTRERQHHR